MGPRQRQSVDMVSANPDGDSAGTALHRAVSDGWTPTPRGRERIRTEGGDGDQLRESRCRFRDLHRVEVVATPP